MYSCSVAKNSLQENCTKENIVDVNFQCKGCLENVNVLLTFKLNISITNNVNLDKSLYSILRRDDSLF